MITPSFSLASTERVLPKLALDFTTAVLDSRVTFTRTTNATNPATYVNNLGLITEATNDQPRFDYDSTTLACKGLLIEESRTNLALYSNNFDFSSIWGFRVFGQWAAASVTPNVAIAPDGTTTVDAVYFSSTPMARLQRVAVTPGATYTVSMWMGNNGISLPPGCSLRVAAGNNGTLFSSSFAVLDISGINLPSDGKLVRKTLTFTIPASGVNQIEFGPSFQGAAGQTPTIYCWGGQCEAGAFATSYIPTTSAALTRNADVATMTGTNFSSWYNASAGTFEATVIKQANGGLPYFFNVTDGTANNNITCFSYTNNDAEYQVITGGVSQANPYTAGSQLLAGNIRTLGLSYKNSAFYGAFNGAAMPNGNPVLSGTVPTVTYLQFGMYSAATNRQGFWIQKLRYWPQSLTNAETVAFSK